MSAPPIRIGTRGSRLALWQATTVAALLESGGARVEIVTIKTDGDRLQTRPLSDTGTKRLFVKEIEDALLDRGVDVAVHSAKDMTVDQPEGLEITATLPREDPRDALVLPAHRPATDLGSALAALGPRPAIGTSSVRRIAQLIPVLPGARFAPIRGNVDTRLKKLDDGEFDALILASAGMRRLGVGERISVALPFETCVPAPGQGIIAIQTRRDDVATREAVERLHDPVAGAALAAERALVAALGGGCQLPLGAIAIHEAGELDMQAVVISLDGATVIRARRRGPFDEPAGLGRQLAADLSRAGAREVLEVVRRGQ
ncbi:MAG: hydroxymethylbilane synthase [Vicinamibacterales bacterium]